MPELPEVETICRALVPVVTQHQIKEAHVMRGDLRWELPQKLAKRLKGRICGHPYRRAKYILIPMLKSAKGEEETLLLHLGMSGSIRIYAKKPSLGRHDHVAVEMEGGDWFVFCDPRRFGYIDLIKGACMSHRLLKRLGVEPLSNAFSAAYLDGRLAKKHTPIKTALLDQTIIAGLGNIYVNEALFMAGIAPDKKAHAIKTEQNERLVRAIRDVLEQAIKAGGTSLKDHVQPDGKIGYFAQKLKIYGRKGLPCIHCQTIIKMSRQAGRSSFYCPQCQI